MKRGTFLKLTAPFALAAACSLYSNNPAHGCMAGYQQQSATQAYFADTGYAPRGYTVEFEDFKNLPQKWQAVLNNSGNVQGYAGHSGHDLYTRLDPRLRAAILNIMAKSDATTLADGSTVLDHIREIRTIHQDRFFAYVDDVLSGDMKTGALEKLFYHRTALDSSLHHALPGFAKMGSYKTYDKNGNLDMTLSTDGRIWRAEIDIDEWKGFHHAIREVAWHHVFNKLTNPYKVEPILECRQDIDPHYRIVPLKHNGGGFPLPKLIASK